MTVTFAKLGKFGRLGNQLWQCAATIGYSMRYNVDYIFPRWEYENDFNIPLNKFTNNINYNFTYEEPHFHWTNIPFREKQNLHGYFQSKKYWENCESEVKKLLTPKRNYEKLTGYTSIHVRRTDYLKHEGCYEILDMNNYYEKTIIAAPSNKFLIFSDDISWCKDHFKGNQFEFSEGNSVIDDLSLMSKCDHNIIANSSFSYWGSVLNTNPQKTIIAPKRWFGPKLAPTHDTKDLLPSEWLKVG